MSHKVDFDAIAGEILEVMHNHGLMPNILGLIVNVPDEQFEALAQQYPNNRQPHHGPGMILIKQKDQWFIQIQPILKPGDYPSGEMLRPSTKR